MTAAIAQRLDDSAQEVCIPLAKGEDGHDVSNGFTGPGAGGLAPSVASVLSLYLY
jgi:hypothetical protein